MSVSEPLEGGAPDLSLRARPPSPRRLSRKVLLTGATVFAAIVVIALFVGLSDRPSRVGQANQESAASAGPPETIRQAPSQYELSSPVDELGAPMREQDQEPALQAQTPAPRARADGGASSSDVDPAEAARLAPILFAAQRDGRGSNAATDRARLAARLTPPRSRYEILAGSVIPAALLTELNSDLPGRVVAQVTAPVFDSVSGAHLLVPQGARLIGVYESNVGNGDERLAVVWQRLILPNGWSIDLSDMEGADPAGAAGLRDRVDNHLARLATAVFLSSIMSVGANAAEDDDEARGFVQSVGDAAAEEAARSGARIVERDLEIAPTIRVRAGAPVRVLVMRDIALRPYDARHR